MKGVVLVAVALALSGCGGEAPLPADVESRSGSRNKAVHWVTDDGFDKVVRFHDEQLDVDCELLHIGGGVRCVPYVYAQTAEETFVYRTYADAECREPLLGRKGFVALSEEPGYVCPFPDLELYLPGDPVSEVYEDSNGPCAARPVPEGVKYFRLGERVSFEDFVAFELRTVRTGGQLEKLYYVGEDGTVAAGPNGWKLPEWHDVRNGTDCGPFSIGGTVLCSPVSSPVPEEEKQCNPELVPHVPHDRLAALTSVTLGGRRITDSAMTYRGLIGNRSNELHDARFDATCTRMPMGGTYRCIPAGERVVSTVDRLPPRASDCPTMPDQPPSEWLFAVAYGDLMSPWQVFRAPAPDRIDCGELLDEGEFVEMREHIR